MTKINKRLPKFHAENNRKEKKYLKKLDLGDHSELASFKEHTKIKNRKENKDIKEC